MGGSQQDVKRAGHTRDRDITPQEKVLLQRRKCRRKVGFQLFLSDFVMIRYVSA